MTTGNKLYAFKVLDKWRACYKAVDGLSVHSCHWTYSDPITAYSTRASKMRKSLLKLLGKVTSNRDALCTAAFLEMKKISCAVIILAPEPFCSVIPTALFSKTS
jgi:hypothetical protein